ncbi:uncharacterized protein LOC129588221 isoform X2 [Paramacrobiotus metropolitanus]|nr:uncharacterized protein LOC129588221 isoform X2 [Paramacrobiotus metropolitanus]XP_055338358.1 uncharacterized protein LOC129588221 isoform X2 [Paramacrobiotus metropolitanus]XP_055338359.1 uncharacterized protein LOC129588221 isoform X2 [Paramacrobiotus metropolitanus]
MVDYLAGHPNVTLMAANSTYYNISRIGVAALITSLAANKLNGSQPDVYAGVVGLALRKVAEKQGIESGYNYTSFLNNVIQAAAKWPYVHGQSADLFANFTKSAIARNLEKQFGDCVQNLDSGYLAGLNYTLFEISSQPPVIVPLVVVVDLEFLITGQFNSTALLQLLRYQNLKQNITNTVAGIKRIMWLIEDINVADHSQIPAMACLVSLINSAVAVTLLWHFTRKLHHSERYQQVPILDEDDEEIN